MYSPTTKSKGNFDILDAYNQIAGAAFRFEQCGHLNIWIYLKDEKLQFHYVELSPLSDYFVAYFPCKKVTHGFSNFEWNRLGRNIARVYFSHI